jgi:radical SAM protein with 4Fe4S-binding SPASM domain
LQTNGLLLNREWARFFRKYHFLIGLSLDGPPHVHDHYRLPRGGKESWSRVADSAKLMLDEGEPQWKLGNIMDARLSEMLNSRKQRDFGKKKATLPAPCRECAWLEYCRGGCTKDRIHKLGDKGRNHFCDAYKTFFAHADNPLRELVSVWRKRQTASQVPASRAIGIGRNEPCPCGSGVKYKKCCGR